MKSVGGDGDVAASRNRCRGTARAETGKLSSTLTVLEPAGRDDLVKLRRELKEPGPERIFHLADAFRAGMSVEEVHALSFVDPWFLDQIEELIDAEVDMVHRGLDGLDKRRLRTVKRMGFSDARIAQLEARLARVEQSTHRAEGSVGRADALVVAFAALAFLIIRAVINTHRATAYAREAANA